MDTRIMEYVVAIAEEGNITKAAENVFLTQSALNQQLLKLEKELGTPLFDRSRHCMVPTYAGKVYVENAKKMLAIKDETYKIISDISNNEKGEISIAFTPERGAMMFSSIYPMFHARYPGFTFRIHELRSKMMDKLLLDGTVRLANTSLFGDDIPDFEYVIFGTEPMVLGLPVTHPLARLAGEDSYKRLPEIDLTLLKDTDFVMNSPATRMREMADLAFKKAGFKPKVLFESTSSRTIVNTVRNQMGAGFFPRYYARPDIPIAYFTVGSEYQWRLGITYLKGTYLSKPEKQLIEMMKAYYLKETEETGWMADF